jgi:hypothetical protein
MNLPNPSNLPPHGDKRHNTPERSSTVKLVFNGNSFVPSDSTEVGRTLLHHLQGRSDHKPYSIIFSQAYDVTLVRPNGAMISNSTIKVGGFIVGPNPGGDPAILELLSEQREKIRLPVLVVSEDWKVLPTRIGWNTPLIKTIEQIKNGSSIVTFKHPGIYLVISGTSEAGIVKFPLQIEKARITADGFIKEAYSTEGQIYTPPQPMVELNELTLPTSVTPSNDNDEYTLAPLEQPSPISSKPIDTLPSNIPPDINSDPRSNEAPRYNSSSELRAARIEIALTRLFSREMRKASKAQKALYVSVLADAAKYQNDKSDPLIFTFNYLALGASSSSTSKIVVDAINRWQRHHQERTIFNEFFWAEYYEDLKTIAPLLFKISGEIDQYSEVKATGKKSKFNKGSST